MSESDFRGALEATYNEMSGESKEEPEAVEPVAPAVEQISESDQAQPAVAQTQVIPEPLQAPMDWSESAKAAFAKAPAEIQAAMLERSKEMQADYTRKTQETARLRKHYEAVDQVLAPHAEYLAKQGTSPAQAIESLMRAQIALDSDPASVILHLAQEKGLNLAQLAQIQSQSTGQVSHPAIQQLSAQVSQLQQQLSAREQEEVSAQALNSIVEFQNEKDANGNLLHPHFEEVKPYLAAAIAEQRDLDPEASDREILEQAYIEATKPLKALEAKLMEQRKQKVEAARKAGVSVTSSPGGAVTSAKPANFREALEQSYDQLSRR